MWCKIEQIYCYALICFSFCDTETLRTVFTDLGFTVVVHNNLTAEAMRRELEKLSTRNFLDDDVLVSSVTHRQSCNLAVTSIYIYFFHSSNLTKFFTLLY